MTAEAAAARQDSHSDVTKTSVAKVDAATLSPDRGQRVGIETARTARTASTDQMPAVDPARFVGRVAKAFQTANDRGGTLQLRLSPPELGSLRLQLTVKNGVMSASIETDNAAARRVLLDHLPQLRDRLAEQNIRVDRFDVDVRQENTGGQANPHGSNQNPYQPQSGAAQPRAQLHRKNRRSKRRRRKCP